MKIANQECCGCGLCAAVCPVGCIAMQPDEEGFSVPCVDESKCIRCDKCKKSCPVNFCAKKETPKVDHARCFYAISADAKQVANASSGGVFPALALQFLCRGGAVIGAAFDRNFDVQLRLIEKMDDLPDLMQAKYVQASVPQDLFADAMKILAEGRALLFTGTPCQIAAFRSFCGAKDYPHLLCAEVICHGVPSPAVWRSYLDAVSRRVSSGIKAVFFRDKSAGWHKFSLRIDCKETQVTQVHKDSPYMQLFLQELISRKSCTECVFKEGKSGADLSLGDFWKLHKIAPERNNSTGVSMVIVHTNSGMDALELAEWEVFQEFSMDCVKVSNRAYFQSIAPHPRREEYFAEFRNSGSKWFDPSNFIARKRKKSLIQRIAALFRKK